MAMIISKIRDQKGQMMVELCMLLPVVIVIAVIVVNAIMFFGDCAKFDRISRNAACAVAASPSYGWNPGQSAAEIQAQVESEMSASNLTSSVDVFVDSNGMETYRATLRFRPTLFGLGLNTEVLGVPLPSLTHTSSITVSPYKPGMLF